MGMDAYNGASQGLGGRSVAPTLLEKSPIESLSSGRDADYHIAESEKCSPVCELSILREHLGRCTADIIGGYLLAGGRIVRSVCGLLLENTGVSLVEGNGTGSSSRGTEQGGGGSRLNRRRPSRPTRGATSVPSRYTAVSVLRNGGGGGTRRQILVEFTPRSLVRVLLMLIAPGVKSSLCPRVRVRYALARLAAAISCILHALHSIALPCKPEVWGRLDLTTGTARSSRPLLSRPCVAQ